MMGKLVNLFVPKKIISKLEEIYSLLARQYYSRIYKPLIIRENTTDYEVFKAVFILNEFKLPIKINPKFIIDGGAYTGLSSLYYSSKYPNAQIVAIEPEDSNFEVLRKNTNNRKNISLIKSGLWSRDAFLKIIDPNLGKWGFRVKEVSNNEEGGIPAVNINGLLKKYGFDNIDILKLDIEGSEKEIFLNSSSWIDKVKIIVIELHERIEPGCEKAFYSSFNKNEWNEYRSGEKVVLIRK